MKQKKKRKKNGQRSKSRQKQQPGLSNDVIASLDAEIAEYERKQYGTTSTTK